MALISSIDLQLSIRVCALESLASLGILNREDPSVSGINLHLCEVHRFDPTLHCFNDIHSFTRS